MTKARIDGGRAARFTKHPTCFLVYDGAELLTPEGVDARGVKALEMLGNKDGHRLRVLGVHEMMR